ncbi:MAG: S9 family peptidase [Phycisphaerales bacterium]|nr:S9 family peptidase [Phycisphaerales bacterium]
MPTKTKKTAPRTKKIPMTPDDMLKFQLVSDPRISPDGGCVLFAKQHIGSKNDAVTNLWIVDAASGGAGGGGTPRRFTSGGKDSHGRWSPDGSRIAFISGRDKPKIQIYTMRANGGEAEALTKFPEGAIAGFKWSPNGKMLAVAFREQDPDWTQEAGKQRKEKGLNDPPRVIEDITYRMDGDGYFNKQRFHLYIVDVEAGTHRKVYDKDTLGYFSYDWSPNSREIAITTNRDRRAIINLWNFEILRLDVKTRKLTKVQNVPPGIKESVCWSPDGKRLAYAGQDSKKTLWGCHNSHIFVCDAKRGGAVKITAGDDYCLSATTLSDTAEAAFDANIRWAGNGKHILCKIGWRGESHIARVPAAGGRVAFLTAGHANWNFSDLSSDGTRAAATMQSHTKITEIHLVEFQGKQAKTGVLTKFNAPLWKQRRISEPTMKWLTTPDGTRVQVWMLKPPNFKTGKKYPAVLEIHGGPHAQYGSAFFHEFQVLAANGYVVFFSNPRGSKGYGEDHCAAIKGDWGNHDWHDVQAIIEYMKAQPFVDVKRMGVMGGSYGGYMTNWAIGHTNDFAGAITDRCVSNLVSMAGSSDFPNVPDEYWEGCAWDRPEALWNQSPLKHLGNAKTPTLIIHSEGDLRCNIEQAEQVFTVLKMRKVQTRFVRYPRSTSHGMSRGGPTDMRIHRLGQILDWWKKYL